MAKANIQRAMQMLDPDTCAEVYELPNLMARESFRLEQERVANFDELIDLCCRYYLHHFHRVLAPNVDPPDDYLRGFVHDILEHGYKGGREAAFQAATRGLNGGLPGVLDAIRDHFMKEHEERYFSHAVMESVDIMDLEDVEELMNQYLQRYGRHMDGDHMPSARYLVTKYRDVIKAHSQIVRNMRINFGR
jgi:hypothetical protein